MDILAYLRELNFASLLLRLLLAMLCGGILGADRIRKHRPAGFRTYIIVSMGAALTMLLSQYLFQMTSGTWADIAKSVGIKTDVSRLGAQVINGIGFLGAGTIMITGRKHVKGITTAAGLFAAACIGLAIGAGFYECAFLALPIIIISMGVLPQVDIAIRERSRNMDVYIEIDNLDNLGELLTTIKNEVSGINDVDIERNEKYNPINPAAVLSLRLNKRQPHTQVLSVLAAQDYVFYVEEI